MTITLHYFNKTMKKLIVAALMAMFCVTMQAQEVKTEVTLEMPGED